MSDFINAAKVSEITPGNGKTVEINGTPVAIFNVNGKFHAIHDTCVHAGGPLGDGFLEDNVVTCPWHGSLRARRAASLPTRQAETCR